MTYEELIDNPDFIGFCEKWKAERWCPAPLVDWLLERGMELQAEAARWAVNTEERRGSSGTWHSDVPVRTYPYESMFGRGFRFIPFQMVPIRNSSEVPIVNFTEFKREFNETIADYLLVFDPELACKYPPKECIV